VPKVNESAKSEDVLEIFEREEVPVVPVTCSEGKLVGSVLEREVPRFPLTKRPRGREPT